MTLVFQYGSNMSSARLNAKNRLAGDATVVGVALTLERFELVFSVWSKSNNCAAADIVPNENGRQIYGVLYEIPDYLMSRDSSAGRNSLDAIEGEGTNYVRTAIDVTVNPHSVVRASTYCVKNRQYNLKTSASYATHILTGLREHGMPDEYQKYVQQKIIENNEDLRVALRLETTA